MPNELTNPDKVVTEERLAEFYQQILPYLGGMPDVMMSKFSKSDIYSAGERMVGVWTDGKPLYQKTFSVTSKADGTLFTFPDTYEIREFTGIVGGGESLNCLYDSSHYVFTSIDPTNHLVFQKIAGYIGQTEYVTLIYTKTTDSPVVVGDANDYSMTEKIVGTWIDGKPVWQKTVDCGALPNNTTKTVAHGVSAIDKIIDIRGVAYNASGALSAQSLPLVYENGIKEYDTRLSADATSITFVNKSDRSMMVGYVTLQYTKTSS